MRWHGQRDRVLCCRHGSHIVRPATQRGVPPQHCPVWTKVQCRRHSSQHDVAVAIKCVCVNRKRVFVIGVSFLCQQPHLMKLIACRPNKRLRKGCLSQIGRSQANQSTMSSCSCPPSPSSCAERCLPASLSLGPSLDHRHHQASAQTTRRRDQNGPTRICRRLRGFQR